MSLDDATMDAPETVTDEAATEEKKSMKGMAFLDKSGEKMDNVPGVNKIPRSMRVLTLLIVLILIIAIVAVAWPSGEKAPDEPTTVDVASLEDWTWSSDPIAGYMTEFTSASWGLGPMIENMTVLVSRVEMTLTWQDEPDETWAGRVRENSPDSFQCEIIGGNASITATSEMVSNDPTSRDGMVSLVLDMSSTNFTYVLMGNYTGTDLPDGITEVFINAWIIMGEAGDFYASGPAMFKLNDFGNDYTLTIHAEGKVLPSE